MSACLLNVSVCSYTYYYDRKWQEKCKALSLSEVAEQKKSKELGSPNTGLLPYILESQSQMRTPHK